VVRVGSDGTESGLHCTCSISYPHVLAREALEQQEPPLPVGNHSDLLNFHMGNAP
jgi:hypothetical protein